MRHIALGMAFLLLGSGPALAGQCEAGKLKVVANTTVKLAACLAKAVKKGLPLDSTSTCLADADEKFLRDIAKVEAKGPCDVSGNTATIETALARFILVDLTTQLPDPGPSKCEASKWKATATKVKAKLACRAKAEKKGGPLDSECVSKAEDKFAASFAKADSKAACTGDPVAIEATVDALLVGIINQTLDVCSRPGTPNGTPCDDHIACTAGEFCVFGVCQTNGSTCQSVGLCQYAWCDAESGECRTADVTCPDVPGTDPACWSRDCQSDTGACISIFHKVGTCSPNECNQDADCNDDDACTDDVCGGEIGFRQCQWSRSDCDDFNLCTRDFCDNPAEGCKHVFDNLQFCDDHASCTDDDFADNPVCVSQASDCKYTPHDDRCADDNEACTTDVCNPAAAGADPSTGCAHPFSCNDGNDSTSDLCKRDTGECVHDRNFVLIPFCGGQSAQDPPVPCGAGSTCVSLAAGLASGSGVGEFTFCRRNSDGLLLCRLCTGQ